jgi:hypothetical protein
LLLGYLLIWSGNFNNSRSSCILFRLIQIRSIDNSDVVFWRECADNRPGQCDVEEALDIVGTGGDGANTVNISTGACILAAACGASVAKVKKVFIQEKDWFISARLHSNALFAYRLLVIIHIWTLNIHDNNAFTEYPDVGLVHH